MTEQHIEQALIEKLGDLKYQYRPDLCDRAALEHNFRQHFEVLNRVHLTDSEFARLLESIVTPDVFAAAKHLRERNHFERDDGTPLYYTLVNIKDWCKNNFEVVNQLRINTDYSHHRFDVILLINSVPVVQIELKTLAISPRRAMQQIVDYKNDPGNGYTKTLLCFLQLFIVSNRRHFSFNADERFLPLYQFASVDNQKITHLDHFADAFLTKCTLGQMISRYMVLVASEQKLLMMRPYQIYAVKAIVECIHQHCGNGYIWHTTGSRKTLTSFKASTLLKDNPDIDKCLFVVDRKDLDRQTREEFNKFQEGCVEENTNTETLVRRLLSDDYADKVIVTTIQKLGLALDGANPRNYQERLEPLRHQRLGFIFDECHRSQFGENHQAIKAFFPNAQYGSNHRISEFDLYYQDVQKRIKDQQYPNADLPHAQKIDITIVVDMLLTGFDSKYLNTLYVDKNLKYHGLIQALSRTNRVLNDTKPYGNILDFRQQQDAVDTAISLFSGAATKPAKEIWLVDQAPVVIDRLQTAVQQLDTFMQSQGLENQPEAVPNLKGDAARAQFINLFKEVQRLNTQIDQYTDLTPEHKARIEQVLPRKQLQGFKGVYLDTAQRLKDKQDRHDDSTPPEVQQIDFEFVLFASAVIDYDYIMALIARYASQAPGQQTMSRAELLGLIQSDAKLLDDREALIEYIDSLDAHQPHTVQGVREEYAQYKVTKTTQALADVAKQHRLDAAALQGFVDGILRRMIFDGEQLSDLMAPLEVGWKARTRAELALMADLIPLLHKLAQGREISGLGAYEQ